ncbi:MAG: hypothetical protein OQK79_03035 [Rhodanobacter sp.]|nr:hypothetical protein [Rhodanobacter sp.]
MFGELEQQLLEVGNASAQRFLQATRANGEACLKHLLGAIGPTPDVEKGGLAGRMQGASILSDIHE